MWIKHFVKLVLNGTASSTQRRKIQDSPSLLTSDGQHRRPGDLRHGVRRRAAVVARVAGLEAGDGQETRVLVDASDLGSRRAGVRQQRDPVLLPLDLDGQVPLGHGADRPKALAPGQVLREREGFHNRCNYFGMVRDKEVQKRG